MLCHDAQGLCCLAEAFGWVMGWHTVVDPDMFARLLADELFPAWLHVLYMWLTASGPMYGDIMEWYQYWKSVFPEELIEHPVVERQFRKALDMLNQSIADAAGGL